MTSLFSHDIKMDMSIKEIFELALKDHSIWFRPKSWENTGQAYQVQDGKTVIVPAPIFHPYMSPEAKYFTEDWEIVSHDRVLDEL